jgi:CRP-like cAMP-binding protein
MALKPCEPAADRTPPRVSQVVPIILQDMSWDGYDGLAREPRVAYAAGSPLWLPMRYNASTLLNVYETRVSLGKLYLTSVYWALTMVMKSPWLPPKSTGEQAVACLYVVMGAVTFAWFLGQVTTMIQSFDKANANYRDQMTLLHNFFAKHTLPKYLQKVALSYSDAYFNVGIQGVTSNEIIRKLPAHLRPSLLMEVHSDLLNNCHFLHECSYSGVADFLAKLNPEVCLKADTLLRAGTMSDYMYILHMGELQVSFPEDGSRVKASAALGVDVDLLSTESSASKRIPHGRIERRGSLIGWRAPFGQEHTVQYTVRAYRYSQLHSITVDALRSVLLKHSCDAGCFLKAVEHANRLLSPVTRRSQCAAPHEAGRASIAPKSLVDVHETHEKEVSDMVNAEINLRRRSRTSIRHSGNNEKKRVSCVATNPKAGEELAKAVGRRSFIVDTSEAVQTGWLPKPASSGVDINFDELRGWMREREEEERKTREMLLQAISSQNGRHAEHDALSA